MIIFSETTIRFIDDVIVNNIKFFVYSINYIINNILHIHLFFPIKIQKKNMKTYIKFFLIIFYKAFLYSTAITLSLVFIMSLLSELDFFKEINVNIYTPLLLSFLISPSVIFEMFPFIFLITGQLFFIKLFDNNQIDTFKYSGLKNTKIIIILSFISLFTGLFIISVFYSFSANLKNLYLELKSPYTTDGKYLAVITKNGLWIRDKIDNKIIIINSSKIEMKFNK